MKMAMLICIVGVMYCMRPMVDNGIFFAPMPKRSSGRAVAKPADTSSSACPAPCAVKVPVPCRPK